jgi:hypothetical protein
VTDEHQLVRDFGRPPEHGRIRLGIKDGKAMRHIDTLRFTSPDRNAIDHPGW